MPTRHAALRGRFVAKPAAHRGGIKTVLIPQQNVKDLTDVPENIKNHLDIHPVQWIDDVLKLALASTPVPIASEADVHENPAKEVQLADNAKESQSTSTDAIKH